MLLILFAGLLPIARDDEPVPVRPEPFWQHLQDIGLHLILPALTLMLTAVRRVTR